MSRFLTERQSKLTPYVPGEQPRDRRYLKLNTNESPFPPPEGVIKAVSEAASTLRLYSDPESQDLREAMASVYGVGIDRITMNNGSDETLNFAFMAFADEKSPLIFPDITYGCYTVFADLNHIPYEEVPLAEDLSIRAEDYIGVNKTVVIANPNAPTGRFLPLKDIERIVASNPGNVVIIDEAYVDFGGESAVSLIDRYPNLLVVGTFSKSRSMAGARLGFGIGDPGLIADLNRIRNSTNPYNVNLLTSAAGVAALREQSYYDERCRMIMENREWTRKELEGLGFEVIPSKANFLFARSREIGGKELYLSLKRKGVLIRHFERERICEYNRITIGTMEEMQTLIGKIREILEERKS